MSEFVSTRMGHRSTTHLLDIEKIDRKKFALRFADKRGLKHYITGAWGDALASAVERARILIREGGVAIRSKKR